MVGILTPQMNESYTKSAVHSVILKLSNNVKTRIFQENAQDIPFVSLNSPVIHRRVPWSLTNFLRKRSSGYVRCRGDFDETQSLDDIKLSVRNYSCSERKSWPSVTNTQFTDAYGEIVLPSTASEIDFHSLFRRLLQSGLQVPVDLMTNGDMNYDTYYRILDCYANWKLQNPKLQNPPYSIESNFVLLLNIIYSGACMLPELNFSQNSQAAIIISEIHRRLEILFKKNPHSLFTLARNKVRQIFPRKYFRELLSSGLSTNHIKFSNKADDLKELVQWLNIVQALPDNIRYNLMFLERRSLERELDFLLSFDLNDELL
ncbi:hypothetical protein ACTXT7_008334 [Hymenolepis weldensis]